MGAIVRISSVCCPALVEWGVAHGSQHLWGPLMGALHPDLFPPSFGFCSKILKVFLVHIRKYKWFPNGSHPSLSFLKLFYTTFFSRWPAVLMAWCQTPTQRTLSSPWSQVIFLVTLSVGQHGMLVFPFAAWALWGLAVPGFVASPHSSPQQCFPCWT